MNLASTLDELGEVAAINDIAIETLPVLMDAQVIEFVTRMLDSREVPFEPDVPETLLFANLLKQLVSILRTVLPCCLVKYFAIVIGYVIELPLQKMIVQLVMLGFAHRHPHG